MSPPTRAPAVRDGSRDALRAGTGRPRCPLCEAPLPGARARYCSAACKQRAYRLRRRTPAPDLTGLRRALHRQRALAAHTVYECPACEERSLGERRCPDCHLFCRALGLGGRCPDCDQPILLADLLGPEVLP